MQQQTTNTIVVSVGQPSRSVGASFGITSTPNPGWGCCNTPPCVCCGHPIYFSDNHKTWGETGSYHLACCGLCGWSVKNAKVGPGGNAYDYEYTKPCCGDGLLTVSRGGAEVGRLLLHSYCCPCDKTMINSLDTNGKSLWTLRSLPCKCCGGGGGGCCNCSCWGRSDNMWLSDGEGKPREPYVASAGWQYHRCCPQWYPWWFGYDAPPSSNEDDRAILLGFLLVHGNMPYYRIQPARISAYPFSFGHVA
jgi:hypothetical protein